MCTLEGDTDIDTYEHTGGDNGNTVLEEAVELGAAVTEMEDD